MREKYQLEIENKINNMDIGAAFSALDFRDIAGTDPINKALSRLYEEGKIRRVMQGIYDKPAYSKLIGEYSEPNLNNVAHALARKFNWTIAPAEETALNQLHMSTQITNTYCYISDGPYREYKIKPYLIKFKHCANKEISGHCNITNLVIQALKFIGKDRIQDEDIERLSLTLSDEEKKVVLEEAKTSTTWIYEILKGVCEE